MERTLFDYEDRLFLIIDGSSGFVLTGGKWEAIEPELAGRVWASGSAPRKPLTKTYGKGADTQPE